MKYTLSLILSLLMSFTFAHAQVINAKVLLANSKAYHDPSGKLLSSNLTFDFIETRPGGKDRSTTVSANIKEETFRLLQSRDSFLIDSNWCVRLETLAIYQKSKLSYQKTKMGESAAVSPVLLQYK